MLDVQFVTDACELESGELRAIVRSDDQRLIPFVELTTKEALLQGVSRVTSQTVPTGRVAYDVAVEDVDEGEYVEIPIFSLDVSEFDVPLPQLIRSRDRTVACKPSHRLVPSLIGCLQQIHLLAEPIDLLPVDEKLSLAP